MKKICLFTVFVLNIIICNNLFAQTSFGVRGGMNVSNMKIPLLGSSSKVGLNIGAFAQVPINENFVVQPEIAYSAMGGIINFFGSYKVSSDYVSLPILVKYNLNNFSLGFGPQIGYLISAKSTDGVEVNRMTNEYKSIDISGIFNADFSISENIILGARYQLGFSNIMNTKNLEEDILLLPSVKNNAFQFLIGYKF
jgi:hypothetical protein